MNLFFFKNPDDSIAIAQQSCHEDFFQLKTEDKCFNKQSLRCSMFNFIYKTRLKLQIKNVMFATFLDTHTQCPLQHLQITNHHGNQIEPHFLLSFTSFKNNNHATASLCAPMQCHTQQLITYSGICLAVICSVCYPARCNCLQR